MGLYKGQEGMILNQCFCLQYITLYEAEYGMASFEGKVMCDIDQRVVLYNRALVGTSLSEVDFQLGFLTLKLI